jgi:hypothetical protein
MTDVHDKVLSPVGPISTQSGAGAARVRSAGGKKVVGLIDNSKPNVRLFLHAIEEELRATGAYDTVTVTKPRSAGACPDLDALAARCDFVVNAVAD